MRVATWNVNGLRARLDFFLHWLRARQPDVVGGPAYTYRPGHQATAATSALLEAEVSFAVGQPKICVAQTERNVDGRRSSDSSSEHPDARSDGASRETVWSAVERPSDSNKFQPF